MKVVVKYFGWLSMEKGNEVVVEVKEGATINDVVDLPGDVDLDDLIILKNGISVKPDEKVEDGDVISVMPHISGGFE